MPRKKLSQPETILFYPNKIKLADLKNDVMNDYNGKIADVNFFLFFNIICEPYIELRCSDKQQYIQIHSDILRCIFRNQYNEVIEKLIKFEYIQRDNGYSNSTYGGYTKTYRINPKRIDVTAPLSYIKQTVNGFFVRKLTTLKQVNLSQNSFNNEGNFKGIVPDTARQHVIDQTSNLMLVPDREALEYVTSVYRENNNPNLAETYFHYFNNTPLKRISIDKFGCRVHSVITNMPKVIRRCLRFNSSPLASVMELDIVNSQPFFLSSVTSALIAKFVPDAAQAIPVFKRYEDDPNFIKFRDLCRNGKIYEFLQAAYEIDYGTICEGNSKAKRDFTKRLTYGVLFGDYELKDSLMDRECKTQLAQVNNNFYKVYKATFLAVYSLFKAVKALQMDCTVNNKGERKQYANNCLIAQRLESGVFYSHIVQSCIDNGYTELVTVHDCVIVRADEYDQIKDIALNEFQNLNLNPKLN